MTAPYRHCVFYGRRGPLRIKGLHRFTAREVRRQRGVVVHDQPFAVDFLEASRPAEPVVALLPTGHGTHKSVEAETECDVVADREAQVAEFKVNCPLESRECRFERLALGI